MDALNTKIGQKFLTLVPSYLERIAEALEKISTTLEKMLEVKSEYR